MESLELPSGATRADAAECSILGAMLMGPHGLAAGMALPVEAFWHERHRRIVASIRRLVDSGIEPDVATVADELASRPVAGGTELEAVGGRSYLDDVFNSVPTALNAGYYAAQVRQAWVRRGLAEAAERLYRMAADGHVSLDEIRSHLVRAAGAVDSGVARTGPRLLRDLLAERLDYWEAVAQGQVEQGVRTTGFIDLDRAALPWQPGDLVVLSADGTGRGKTSLAMQIALSVAETGQRVLYSSIEMTGEALADRLAVQRAGMTLWGLRHGKVNWEAVCELVGFPEGGCTWIDDGSRTSFDVAATAQRLALEKGPLGMVVVDHVHELADPGGRGEDTVASRMAGIMGRLKGLAKDLRCVLLVVAQTNRQGRRAEREPELSDLRDSAAIEDKASVVLFIHHAKDKAGRMWPARLLVAKNRNGAGGARIDLLWDAERAMFRSVARMQEPPGRRGDDPDADR